MSDGLTLPLVILKADNTLISVLLMNRKSFGKSIERNELWVVHPVTARVLPLSGQGFSSLNDKNQSWYQVVLNNEQADFFLKSFKEKENLMDNPGYIEKDAQAVQEGTLEKLEQIIASRRKEMPEGSYTSHLFEKGEDKIRKKTGEEAIELVLAQKKEDIIYEAADLIYHMMILLEVKDISYRDVFSELEKRNK